MPLHKQGYDYRVVLRRDLENPESHHYLVVKFGREKNWKEKGWKIGPSWGDLGVTLIAKCGLLESGWEVVCDYYGGVMIRREAVR